MSTQDRTHYEKSLELDLRQIRGQIVRMGALCEGAIRRCVRALRTGDAQLAYAVIIRDQQIDQLEKDIDQLCLEFLARQQPVAHLLRFAYSAIRINLELERIGDYAESIAHQMLKLIGTDIAVPIDRYEEISEASVRMLHEAVRAFGEQNSELAQATMAQEEAVDLLKRNLNRDLVAMFRESPIPFAALNAFMMITRRFERVSDQAGNICREVIYTCTGDFAKHANAAKYHVLFADGHNAGVSQMAEALALSLNRTDFVFASAGVDPQPVDGRVARWMQQKGFDLSQAVPQAIGELPHPDRFPIVVLLDPAARQAFPKTPHKLIFMEWNVSDPADDPQPQDAWETRCEDTFELLRRRIDDLVESITSEE